MEKVTFEEYREFLSVELERKTLELGIGQRLEALKAEGIDFDEAVDIMSDDYEADALHFVERLEGYWKDLSTKYGFAFDGPYKISDDLLIERVAEDSWFRKVGVMQ